MTVVHARVVSPANRSRDLQQSSEVRWPHKTYKETNLPRTTSDKNDKSRITGSRYSPALGKSVLEIRKLAKSALLGLLPHSIRYADVLAAGVDETTLRSLYEEIGVKVPPRTVPTRTEKTDDNNNMGQKHSTRLSTPNGRTNEPGDHPASLVVQLPPPLPSSGPKTFGTKQTRQDMVGHSEKELRSPTGEPMKHQEEVKSGAGSFPLPIAKVTTVKSSQPTVTSSKPLERKDYIARMLAAKSATAKAPSAPTLSTQGAPLVKGSFNDVTKDDTGVLLKAPNTKELPSSKLSSKGSKVMDSEAIKQAQTDLARQKMEELKNRNSTQPEQALPSRVEPRAQPNVTPAPVPSITSAPSKSTQAQHFVPSKPSTPQPLQQAKLIYKSRPESPKDPTISQADKVPVGAAPFSGIPGLFMTSAPLPATQSVTSLTSTVQPPSTPAGISSTNARKRPLAADLNDLSTNTLKRPFGQTRHVEVVIDVSDDDVVDMADDSDMEIEDAEKGIIPRQSQTATNNSTMKSLHDPQLLRDTVHRKSVVATSSLNTPSAPQTPGKGKRPEDLRSREEQIQLMHKKIAALEQRQKSKPSTSRAHTPGTPRVLATAPSPKAMPAGEVKPTVPTQADSEKSIPQVNRNPTADESKAAEVAAAEEKRASERRALEQRVMEQKISERKASEQKVLELEAAKLRAEQAELAIAAVNAKRRRKAEIESGLPILDAEVQRTKIKLEEMKTEIYRLEAEVQKGLEGRKSLVEELESLGVDTEGMPLEQLQAKKDEILELQQAAEEKQGEFDITSIPKLVFEVSLSWQRSFSAR